MCSAKDLAQTVHISGTIGEILEHKAPTLWRVAPNATVFEAITLMAEKNIGALLVMDGDRLIGVLSERDYTRKVALRGKSSRETSVQEILSSPIISAVPDSTVQECMRL